jgi:hypothetical protein
MLSNRKTILIPGSLEKTVPPGDSILYAITAKLCQMGNVTKSTHPPQIKKLGRQFCSNKQYKAPIVPHKMQIKQSTKLRANRTNNQNMC